MFKLITTVDDKIYLCEDEEKFGSKTRLFNAVEIKGCNVCDCCGDTFEDCECTCGCIIGESNCFFDFEKENYLAKCYIDAKLNDTLEAPQLLSKNILSSKNKSKVKSYVDIMLDHIPEAEKKIHNNMLLTELYKHLDS